MQKEKKGSGQNDAILKTKIIKEKAADKIIATSQTEASRQAVEEVVSEEATLSETVKNEEACLGVEVEAIKEKASNEIVEEAANEESCLEIVKEAVKEESYLEVEKEGRVKNASLISAKSITVLAICLALMFVLTPIPFASLFLVPLLFLGLTHNVAYGAIGGLMFGCVSLMYAFVGPTSPVAIAFTEAPYIAILPRIVVGVVTPLAFKGFRKAIKPISKVKKILPYNLAATIGTLTNTVLVVPLLVLLSHINPNFANGEIIPSLWFIFIFAAIELVVANLIVPAVTYPTAKALKLGEFRR